MASFVHLTPEERVRRVLRSGIRARVTWVTNPADHSRVCGVYAMPVTPSFVLTHQWLRELKRRGTRTILGVYFRIPDDQSVWVGRYNGEHRLTTASEAVALLMSAERFDGFEVIVPRSIESREISKARSLPQVAGWRYYPESSGHPPFCGCPWCVRGQIKCRRLRVAWEEGRPARSNPA